MILLNRFPETIPIAIVLGSFWQLQSAAGFSSSLYPAQLSRLQLPKSQVQEAVIALLLVPVGATGHHMMVTTLWMLFPRGIRLILSVTCSTVLLIDPAAADSGS